MRAGELLTAARRRAANLAWRATGGPPVHREDFGPAAGGFERLYHVHIRKCAGSGLNQAFVRRFAGVDAFERLAAKPDHRLVFDGRPVVGWNPQLIERGAYVYAFCHTPFHALTLPPKTFSFAFFRDPVARLLSHYQMLCDMAAEGSSHVALRDEGAWIEAGFGGFLDRIPRQHLQNQLYMFDAGFDVDAALERVRRLSYCGVVGDIEPDFLPMLERRFGLRLDYARSNPSRTRYPLTVGERARAEGLLAEELLFFERVRGELGGAEGR